MGLITKVLPSWNTDLYLPTISGYLAGEALEIASPCYLKSGDGLIYLSNGTAADEEAEVLGFTTAAVAAGNPVTLVGKGARFRYAASMTPGNILYVGGTNGRLDTGATTGDTQGVAIVLTATDILVARDFKFTQQVAKPMNVTLLDGAAAGAHVLTGMNTGDSIGFVGHITTKASIATLADLTSEFTAGVDDCNNAAGTDTTNDQLLVFWTDLT